MDHIETTLRLLEEFMSTPLPYRKVDFVVSENIQELATQSGSGEILIGEGHPEQLIERNAWIATVYVHEMAHFYWGSGPWWISEGAATFLQDVWRTAQDGTPLIPDFDVGGKCLTVLNLKHLEEPIYTDVTDCQYTMGALLFHDLHRALGEHSFRTGFRRLYLLSQHGDPSDECDGIRLTVCHVRAAFTERMPEETAEAARQVIDKWYDGEYPRYWTDTTTIIGNVLSRDGNPLDGIGLSLLSGKHGWYSTSLADGSFYFNVKQGAFKLQVHPPRGCNFEVWYGGEGRMVSSSDEAVELILAGPVPESIEIRLPISSDDVHCGALAIRGMFIAPDGERSVIPGTGRGLREFGQIVVFAGSTRLGEVDSYSEILPSETFEFKLLVADGLAVQLRFVGITNAGEWLELGWLGENGLTKDFSKAITFNLDGKDIEGVEITLQVLP